MPTAQVRGGAEQSLLQAVRHRGPRAQWTVVLLEDGPLRERLRAVGADVELIDAGRLRQPHRLVVAIRRLRKLLRARRFDIAIGWMTKAQLYLGPAAARTGVPALWCQLSNPQPRFWMDRLALRLPTQAVVTVSEAARAIQASASEIPTELVYPGAELDRFDPEVVPTPSAARAKLGLPASGHVIGIVGRLQRWKGMHTLVDAMPAILEAFADTTCVIVGGEHPLERDYPDELHRRVAAQGLAEHVVFAGAQPNVEEWMQAMDVVVHASDNEPFGIVIIEAMGLGKPIVAPASGGPREIITDGSDGVLVEPGDPGALAAAVIRLLGDPAERARLGAGARRTAPRFSAVAYAQGLEAVLERYRRVP